MEFSCFLDKSPQDLYYTRINMEYIFTLLCSVKPLQLYVRIVLWKCEADSNSQILDIVPSYLLILNNIILQLQWHVNYFSTCAYMHASYYLVRALSDCLIVSSIKITCISVYIYELSRLTSSCCNKQLSLTRFIISVLTESYVVKLISMLLSGSSTFYLCLLLVITSKVLVFDLGVKLLVLDLTDHEP